METNSSASFFLPQNLPEEIHAAKKIVTLFLPCRHTSRKNASAKTTCIRENRIPRADIVHEFPARKILLHFSYGYAQLWITRRFCYTFLTVMHIFLWKTGKFCYTFLTGTGFRECPEIKAPRHPPKKFCYTFLTVLLHFYYFLPFKQIDNK